MSQHREGIKGEGVKAQPSLALPALAAQQPPGGAAQTRVSEPHQCCMQNACLLVRAPSRKKQHLQEP